MAKPANKELARRRAEWSWRVQVGHRDEELMVVRMGYRCVAGCGSKRFAAAVGATLMGVSVTLGSVAGATLGSVAGVGRGTGEEVSGGDSVVER
jgi:hypothetical protein